MKKHKHKMKNHKHKWWLHTREGTTTGDGPSSFECDGDRNESFYLGYTDFYGQFSHRLVNGKIEINPKYGKPEPVFPPNKYRLYRVW